MSVTSLVDLKSYFLFVEIWKLSIIQHLFHMDEGRRPP